MLLNNRPLIIYHANCADGFGAAFAAWLRFGYEAEYLPMQYLNAESTHVEFLYELAARGVTANTDREFYILDFSLPKVCMEYLFANARHVIWLDHHKTAFEMWCGEYEKGMSHDDRREPHHVCLDDNKSGAYLAWEYFHPGTEVPMLIRHIDDYDRWQFKLDGTKAFNKALWSYSPWSFEQWRDRFYDQCSGDPYYCDSGRMQLITEGEAILRAHNQNVQSVVKGSARKFQIAIPLPDHKIDGVSRKTIYPGLAANCPPHMSSDVGHELATQSGTFGLLWHLDKNGKCKCSLRSNGDYDVSAIAKAFGGGGHRNAAGFKVQIKTLLGWLK